MANIITELHLEMNDNWYVSKKLNSIGRVGENTVTKLIIEPTEILDNVTYEIEIADASGSKNVAELTIDGSELYLILTANMLTTSGITKMQVRGLFTDGSIKKSNIFELKVNRSISATEHYEEYAVTIFDQLVQDCRDIIEGAESYAVRAETAAVNAEAYEQSASTSAEAASASASTASTSATTATTAAETATAASTSAHTSAETATTAANSASTSASNASTSAQTAQSASVTAQSASEAAQTASEAATTAATSAENSATSASTSASNASASATSAASSATAASTSATSASASATSAVTSETNAAASASSASTSATNAANSASAAETSATNAHNSEVNASNSETNASTSATEAAASAESIAASVAQINENTYRINDLEAIIAGYQQADLPTGAIATVTDGTALLMPSLKVGIEPVQSGSGDPSPENIRPISGWTEANVTRSGKNLFYMTNDNEINAYLDETNKIITNPGHTCYYFPCKANATYTVSKTATVRNGRLGIAYSYEVPSNNLPIYGTQILNSFVVGQRHSLTTTTDASAKYIIVWAFWGVDEDSKDSIQLEFGSEPTTFTPYNANSHTYTIQFKDSDNPLTVYGGTLDVTSGELVVDRGYLTNDYLVNTASYESADRNCFVIIGVTLKTLGASVVDGKLIASALKTDTQSNLYTNRLTGIAHWWNTRIGFSTGDSNVTSVSAFKDWLASNGSDVCYELATPITYQLTPTQIRTLVGNNNIWADTGDIIEGKYFRSLT